VHVLGHRIRTDCEIRVILIVDTITWEVVVIAGVVVMRGAISGSCKSLFKLSKFRYSIGISSPLADFISTETNNGGGGGKGEVNLLTMACNLFRSSSPALRSITS
jgi:hypothetical protein